MVTKGYGFTVKDIDWSCPADLDPYAKAHNEEIKEKDVLMWQWFGTYATNAVGFALDHFMNGKKASMEYIDHPALEKELREKQMTKEQKYEEDVRKAIIAEEQWIAAGKIKGLPETIIKKKKKGDERYGS